MKLTKSRYVEYTLCPKKAWYNLFDKIEEVQVSKRGEEGTRIGKVARDYFDDYKYIGSGGKVPTEKGVYAEYPLRYKNLECLVDILKINDDSSIDIIEVKGINSYRTDSGKIEKIYLEDLSFQYYVAKKMGLDVKSINIMTFNKNYCYDGVNLDIKNLFKIDDVTLEIVDKMKDVEQNISEYNLLNETIPPYFTFSGACKEYDGCPYLDRCKKYKNLPYKNSVYELYKCGKSKFKYIEEGILSFDDLRNSDYYSKISEFNKLFVDSALDNTTDIYVNKQILIKWYSEIKYPIYFFDFETDQQTIPEYPNSYPYQQIPFQYSLHIMNDENTLYEDVIKNNLYYLGDGVNDPREMLIKKMINDLGTHGSIVAYHASFESDRITELARDFKKYEKELNNIKSRLVDLEHAFIYPLKTGKIKKDGKEETKSIVSIYNPKMRNSCSIKHVLPAFFEGDKTLDYTLLDQVHKGNEATENYKLLKTMNLETALKTRYNLLKYCELDTKAMVALFYKIRELLY